MIGIFKRWAQVKFLRYHLVFSYVISLGYSYYDFVILSFFFSFFLHILNWKIYLIFVCYTDASILHLAVVSLLNTKLLIAGYFISLYQLIIQTICHTYKFNSKWNDYIGTIFIYVSSTYCILRLVDNAVLSYFVVSHLYPVSISEQCYMFLFW